MKERRENDVIREACERFGRHGEKTKLHFHCLYARLCASAKLAMKRDAHIAATAGILTKMSKFVIQITLRKRPERILHWFFAFLCLSVLTSKIFSFRRRCGWIAQRLRLFSFPAVSANLIPFDGFAQWTRNRLPGLHGPSLSKRERRAIWLRSASATFWCLSD